MNVSEQRFMELVPHLMKEIVDQLKIANKLKAIEIQANRGSWHPLIDEIIDGKMN